MRAGKARKPLGREVSQALLARREHVGAAIAVEIEEADGGIVGRERRRGGESTERREAAVAFGEVGAGEWR
jgi:hypothetical protein